jgi:hypothetical protein
MIADFRLFLILTFLLFAGGSADASDPAAKEESLAPSCVGRSFVSVAAMIPRRDGFPSVQLALTDPLGRTAGRSSAGEQIPDARYGNIVQIPPQPERSKARAVEVCGAEEGIYNFVVQEERDGPYLIVVTGRSAKNEDSEILNHVGRKDRIRSYRFRFTVVDGRVRVRWLDTEGHEQTMIEDPE